MCDLEQIRTAHFFDIKNKISALHMKLGDNEEVPVDLNYFRETRLQVGVRNSWLELHTSSLVTPELGVLIKA